MRKKTAVGISSVATAALLLGACGGDGGTEDADGAGNGGDGGELTVYYGTPRDIMAPLFAGFREANPDLTVEEFRQPTEELMSTLQLEIQGQQARADVVISATAQLAAIQNDYEAFVSYETADSAAVQDELLDPDGFINPLGVNMYILAYNTDSISEEDAPQSYAEMLDERWSGLISIADPNNSASVHSLIWHITQHLGEEVGSPYGWEYFEPLGELSPRLESSHGTLRDMVISGERPLTFLLVEHIPMLVESGVASWNWPEEGLVAEPLGAGIMESSENQEAAQRFVDYLHSEEGQDIITETMGLAPVRGDVEFEFEDGTQLTDLEITNVDSLYVSQNRQNQADEFHARMGTR